MAIQVRRGQFSKFDASKLLPGEWACVLSGDTNVSDGKAIYVCFAAGTVKRMVTAEELSAFDASIALAITNAQAATSAANGATTRANQATDSVTAITNACDIATGRANAAAQEARDFITNYVIDFEHLSPEAIELIRQAAATAVATITDEQGIGIIDDLSDLIVSGYQTGFITDEEGLDIVDNIFG